VTPGLVSEHEILAGLESGVPPIAGFVLTSVKENPLVEVVLRSPQPATAKNATVLATWTYGAGKAAVWTTDAGARWTRDWTAWEGYDKLFSQLVRWAMRPVGDTGRYTVATSVREGRTQVVVTAVDPDDQFLNDQPLTAVALTPDLQPIDVELEQTAPGRYVGDFASAEAGSYLIAVAPGDGGGVIRTGVSVGYSPEYRDQETNLPLLESLARLNAAGGTAGRLIETDLAADAAGETIAAADPFRRDLKLGHSSQAAWPWFVVAATCLFWGDVFVRRVHVDLRAFGAVVGRFAAKLMGRRPAPAPTDAMSRLKTRKSEIADEIANRRYATEFAAADDVDTSPVRAGDVVVEAPPAVVAANVAPPAAESGAATTSYTERLLKAKKQARRSTEPPNSEDRG
jgi:hypothetical protein